MQPTDDQVRSAIAYLKYKVGNTPEDVPFDDRVRLRDALETVVARFVPKIIKLVPENDAESTSSHDHKYDQPLKTHENIGQHTPAHLKGHSAKSSDNPVTVGPGLEPEIAEADNTYCSYTVPCKEPIMALRHFQRLQEFLRAQIPPSKRGDVFPITNKKGETLAWGGLFLDQEGKDKVNEHPEFHGAQDGMEMEACA